VLNKAGSTTPVYVLVNMAENARAGNEVFSKIQGVAKNFLGIELIFGGAIPYDTAVKEAVRRRLPFTLYKPEGKAARALSENRPVL